MSKKIVIIWCLVILVGFVYLQVIKLNWQQESLQKIIGKEIVLIGKIVKVTEKESRFEYVLTNIKVPEEELASNKKVLIAHWEPEESFSRGDRLKIYTRLKFPARKRNPGGFSYRKYLKRRNIYAVGEVGKDKVKKIGSKSNVIVDCVYKLREEIKSKINSYFSPPYNYLLQALLLGQKSVLPEKIETEFREIGLSHLLVVSGFHVGLISYLIYLIGSNFKASPGVILRINTLLLIIYLIITGFQLPAFRAGLLVILVQLGKYFDREVDLYNLAAGVAVIILLINPWNLFTISFQLSFGAVIGISYLTPRLNNYFNYLPVKIKKIVTATIAAQISLLPILAYYFNQLSLISVVANLILVPLIILTIWLGIGFIVTSFITQLGSKLLSLAIELLLGIGLKLAVWLHTNLNLILYLGKPNLVMIIGYYILIYYLVELMKPALIPYSKDYRKQIIAIFLSLFLIFIIQFNLNDYGKLKIIFFGVNGDAVYLKTPQGKQILIDGGTSEQTLINFLRARGVNKLDLIFISHFHRDHLGGLLPIIKEFRVGKICYPPNLADNKLKLKLIQLAKQQKVELVKLLAGDKVNLPSVKINAYAPWRPLIKEANTNNNSLVLQVSYKQFKALFAGDIELKGEQRLVFRGLKLKSNILKVAHHGSKTSSSTFFLDQVKPELAVISAGENNFHGHPDLTVIKRLISRGIKVLRTDKQGAVTIVTNGSKYNYKTFLD